VLRLNGASARWAASLLVALALLTIGAVAFARPYTHAPAISTWDTRASSVVLGLGRALSGDGAFSLASYNANFSSTSGILSAQFGVHYVTYQNSDASPTARGFSAGGVALINLPLSDRLANGLPGSSFAFYIGGVPTALFSGQLNFISVPLVLGIGVPFSPSPWISIRPWVELSPGLNFDTRIQAISTDAAIQAAMDGTLTQAEVEDLVEQGLNISRETTVGKRAGLSFAVHLGESVDFDSNLIIGAGHAGSVALSGALVFRWDAMAPGVLSERARREGWDCASVEERFRSCSAAHPARPELRPRTPAPRRKSRPGAISPRASDKKAKAPSSATKRRRPVTTSGSRRREPARSRSAASPGTTPAKRAAPRPLPTRAPVAPPKPKTDELPPLMAAPPRLP
jgi:hypothetical protein